MAHQLFGHSLQLHLQIPHGQFSEMWLTPTWPGRFKLVTMACLSTVNYFV